MKNSTHSSLTSRLRATSAKPQSLTSSTTSWLWCWTRCCFHSTLWGCTRTFRSALTRLVVKTIPLAWKFAMGWGSLFSWRRQSTQTFWGYTSGTKPSAKRGKMAKSTHERCFSALLSTIVGGFSCSWVWLRPLCNWSLQGLCRQKAVQNGEVSFTGRVDSSIWWFGSKLFWQWFMRFYRSTHQTRIATCKLCWRVSSRKG